MSSLLQSSPQRKRLPPYARAYAKAAREGLAPANGIAIAGDWTLRNRLAYAASSWRVVVPPDNEPDAFDWSWCKAFDVIVLARSTSRLEAIAAAIRSSGARLAVGLLCQ